MTSSGSRCRSAPGRRGDVGVRLPDGGDGPPGAVVRFGVPGGDDGVRLGCAVRRVQIALSCCRRGWSARAVRRGHEVKERLGYSWRAGEVDVAVNGLIQHSEKSPLPMTARRVRTASAPARLSRNAAGSPPTRSAPTTHPPANPPGHRPVTQLCRVVLTGPGAGYCPVVHGQDLAHRLPRDLQPGHHPLLLSQKGRQLWDLALEFNDPPCAAAARRSSSSSHDTIAASPPEPGHDDPANDPQQQQPATPTSLRKGHTSRGTWSPTPPAPS